MKRLFLGADIGLGGFFFHDKPGEEKTVSYHLATEADKGTALGTIGCAILNEADPNHCAKVEKHPQ